MIQKIKDLLAKYPSIARGLRSGVALGISSLIAYVNHNPMLVWLAPALNALAKAVRDKLGWDWLVI